ncbi:hypothetical protein D3C80_1852570 [compost metagenome]
MRRHTVERCGQSPYRVGIITRHTGLQTALGDTRGSGFEVGKAPFELAYQQIDNQPDQAQAKHCNQRQ